VNLPGGLGIRVDSHAYTGLAVPPFYDSLLAKIIAVGASRTEALDRMSAALSDTRVTGVNTTIGICAKIVNDETFRAGGVSIDYLPNLVSGAAARA